MSGNIAHSQEKQMTQTENNLVEFHVDASQIPNFRMQELISPAGPHRPFFVRMKKKMKNGRIEFVRYRAKNNSIDLIVHV